MTTGKHAVSTNTKAPYGYHILHSYQFSDQACVLRLATNLSRASCLRVVDDLGGAS